jgi:hypothetical protein
MCFGETVVEGQRSERGFFRFRHNSRGGSVV